MCSILDDWSPPGPFKVRRITRIAAQSSLYRLQLGEGAVIVRCRGFRSISRSKCRYCLFPTCIASRESNPTSSPSCSCGTNGDKTGADVDHPPLTARMGSLRVSVALVLAMAACAYGSSTAVKKKKHTPLHVVFVDDVVDHERARLAHDRRLYPGATLDCAHHRAVARPFLNTIRTQPTQE